MIKIIILTLTAFLSGCIHPVNNAALDSWRGVPLIELETHPFFSGLPLEKRPLSNGNELWIFTNLESTITASCRDNPSGMDCKGRSGSKGCLNQFIVGEGIVKEYRPQPMNIPFCVFTCKLRPASRPC